MKLNNLLFQNLKNLAKDNYLKSVKNIKLYKNIYQMILKRINTVGIFYSK
jgi:hypothetical protein